MVKTILQRTVKRTRRRDRQRKRYEDKIKDRTEDWNFALLSEQLKIELDEDAMLRHQLWCPNGHQG